MPDARLENRAFIDVTGADASHFLQSLITTDIDDIGLNQAWPGALLSPQGKILFEFLIGRTAEGFLLETAAENADALVKRLMLYRLRAKVDLARRPETAVSVTWRDDLSADGRGYCDMRFEKAGIDLWRRPAESPGGSEEVSLYHALRLAHGISGGAEDRETTESFPHEMLMDRNGGLDFRKGCYIGQEVVSRMQHRSTARRRLVTVTGATDLPGPGSPLLADEKEIGAIVTSQGRAALAIVRIDKAGAAIKDGKPVMLGGLPVELALPAWSGLDWPSESGESAS